MKQVTVTSGQNIIDIAIQCGGCYEFVFDLLEDNPALDLNNMVQENGELRELKAGDVLNVREDIENYNDRNQAIAAYFSANKIRVNCNWNPDAIGEFLPEDFDDDFIND